MSHPFDTTDHGDFTPTLTRADRDFHRLDADPLPTTPRKRPAHRRASVNRPSAATMFHRLDVCDLLG